MKSLYVDYCLKTKIIHRKLLHAELIVTWNVHFLYELNIYSHVYMVYLHDPIIISPTVTVN